MRLLAVLTLAAVVATLAAAAPSGAATLKRVGTFAGPTYVTAPRGDTRRLFVVERGGTVRVFRDGVKLSQPFVDLSGPVDGDGEGGLLSIAFAPDYATSRLLYVYFTDAEGDIRVEELRRSASNADLADPASRRLVLEIPHRQFGNHKGGQLQFGPDGLLYIGTGDGGGGYDPLENGQRLSTLLGKILRIDPRAEPGRSYRIPPDNPFVGTPGARAEIYSYGLRNPYRFSFDRMNGALTIGDVGQSTVEEVNYATNGAGRGDNYGWDAFEGSRPTPEGGSAPGHVPPVLERLQSAGPCSIIGGYVVRDPSLGSLFGRYVYGDLCVPALRSAVLASPRASDDRTLGPSVETLVSFGEDGSGCLYTVSLNGSVDRLVSSSSEIPCGDRVAPTLFTRADTPQRALSRNAAIAYGRCTELCTVTGSGYVRLGNTKIPIGSDTDRVGAQVRTTLSLGISQRLENRIRRALGWGYTAPVRVSFRARDGAGNPTPVKFRYTRIVR